MGIVDRWRPETAAGGYARDDEAIEFYTRVRALLRPDMTVVDLGAGRGSRFDEPETFNARFCNLHGDVSELIGLDVDPAVLGHPYLDRAAVIEPDADLPLDDVSVDMVVCEYVIEHIERADVFAAEMRRVLKPGGWLCALTPNARGYVGLGNRLVPEGAKDRLMARIWPERPPEDAFATHYRLNTPGQLRAAFRSDEWEHCSYTRASTPKYHANSPVLFAGVALAQALAPSALQTNLYVFLRKRLEEEASSDVPPRAACSAPAA